MDAITMIHSPSMTLHKPTLHHLRAFHVPKSLKHVACMPTPRRSANYQPPLWSFDYIQSLRSDYGASKHLGRASELVEIAKTLLDEETESGRQLELVDAVERLGLSHHFLHEIDQILNRWYAQKYKAEKRPLYFTALEFRLLRQHGFNVPQEVFDCYKNEKGNFDPSLGEDIDGLLQLYEASFLLTPGERTLELAMEFATRVLEEKLKQGSLGGDERFLVRQALEIPIHWRIQRLDVIWFMDMYGKRADMNPVLLELAKVDFNIVQATYVRELQHVSRWWKETGLAEALPFAKDRLVENYFRSLNGIFQPQLSNARIQMTKVNTFVTLTDDIFDVYGTMEELYLFNDAIQGWNVEALEKLPDYMKICLLAINNFIDEIAYDVLKDQGHPLIICHLRKSWEDLFKSFLQEAEWFSVGYTPTMKEYISNAWLSVSGATVLTHLYFLVTNPIEDEAIKQLFKYHNLIQCSSVIQRLVNDMSTSTNEMMRGDVPKSIECYMNETGCNREEARQHIKFLIRENWKTMNEEVRGKDPQVFPEIFLRWAMDLLRMTHYMYQCGDGLGDNNPYIKNKISALLFHPIL